MWFSFSAGSCDGFPRTDPLIFSLLSVAVCSVVVTVSCYGDVREISENEVEELVDEPGTTNGT